LIYLERLDYFEFREAKAYDRNFLTVPPEFWFPELKRRTEALSWSLKMRKMQLNASNTNDANTCSIRVLFSEPRCCEVPGLRKQLRASLFEASWTCFVIGKSANVFAKK
jgi:hypothetical protein